MIHLFNFPCALLNLFVFKQQRREGREAYVFSSVDADQRRNRLLHNVTEGEMTSVWTSGKSNRLFSEPSHPCLRAYVCYFVRLTTDEIRNFFPLHVFNANVIRSKKFDGMCIPLATIPGIDRRTELVKQHTCSRVTKRKKRWLEVVLIVARLQTTQKRNAALHAPKWG